VKNTNQLIELLADNGLEFVVVGGFAGVLHGSSLVTHDLDLCILLRKETVERLQQILKPFNPVYRMTPQRLSFLEIPIDYKRLNNLYLDTDLGQLDLLSEIKGVGTFEKIYKEAETVELFGRECKVMSIDMLIRSKTEMARDKDTAMVKELRVIKEKRRS
jgi:predicted nucleotidyltransferase